MGSAPKFEIYGTVSCSYCAAARMLLKKKGFTYTDILVTNDRVARREMVRKSGRQLVPQIFLDGRPLGGFDELYALEQRGDLDKLFDPDSDSHS